MRQRRIGDAENIGGREATGDAPIGKRSRAQDLVQRKAIDRGELAEGSSPGMAATEGAGAAPDRGVADRVSAATGIDVSGARVHTDASAAQSAAAIGARAYTVGQDIHFGEGQYQPGDPFGMHLLAHELVHTAQQRGAGVETVQPKLEVGSPDDGAEVEADRIADRILRGEAGPPETPQATPAVIRRVPLGLAAGAHAGAALNDNALREQFFRGVAQSQGGDWAGALSTYSSIYTNPGFASSRQGQVAVRWNLGACHQNLGHPAEAISMYQEALGRSEIRPASHARILASLRQVRLQQQGGADAGPAVSEDVLRQRFASGVELMQAGNGAGGLAVFQSIYANPGFANGPHGQTAVRLNIAVCHHMAGHTAEAISMYQELLALPTVTQRYRQQAFDNLRDVRLGVASGTARPDASTGASADELRARFYAGVEIMETDPAGGLARFMSVYSDPAYPVQRVGHVGTTINIAYCHLLLRHYEQAVSFYEDLLVRHDLSGRARETAMTGLRQARIGAANQPAADGEASARPAGSSEWPAAAAAAGSDAAGHGAAGGGGGPDLTPAHLDAGAGNAAAAAPGDGAAEGGAPTTHELDGPGAEHAAPGAQHAAPGAAPAG